MNRTLVKGPICAALMLLAAISQGTGQTVGHAGNPPAHRDGKPEAIFITDFELDTGSISSTKGPLGRRLPRFQEDPEAKARKLVETLAATLTQELQNRGLPARRLFPGDETPLHGWLVKGEFVEVDEGNRIRRAAIGFGAGSTEMMAEMSLFDLDANRNEPILVSGTGSKSGRGPGAVVFMNPYAAAAKFVLSKRAPERDVKKTARQIADVIAKSYEDAGRR